MRVRGGLLAAVAAMLAFGATAPAADAAPPCELPGPDDPTMTPHLDVTGEFSSALEGGYVYVPFEVPAGTTAVRVRYCHDQPELVPANPLPNSPRHVLDLGLFDSREDGELWAMDELRGWAGSSVRDVALSPNGFTSDPAYEQGRKSYVQGRTTRGYQPGPVPAGEWAAELGVAAVASQAEGDADGRVAWRVRVELSEAPSWADEPWSPARYDSSAADRDRDWYAGDFHVHGEHEPGNATMRETFDYAFAPYGGDGAGLDFVTLVDHNNTVAYAEIGRYQDDYSGHLIIPSTEVTTYRGHLQNHASGDLVDYRTGPLYVAELHGSAGIDRIAGPIDASRPARAGLPPSQVFARIRHAGGFTQINHPTIFPSAVPTFDDFCRGCSWDYSAAETNYSKVDAVEVSTGPAGAQFGTSPGPNPFTPLALRFWEDAIDAGGRNANHIAAVGGSDSHQAPKRSQIEPTDPTTAPIGMPTTVVRADELSPRGVAEAVRDAHTYVKLWGADGPDLRLRARRPGSRRAPAIIGDAIRGMEVQFTARVRNLARARAARPGAYQLYVIRDGEPFKGPVPLSGDSARVRFESSGPGRYRLEVERTAQGVASIEAVSSPIWHKPPRRHPRR